jgi:hypothetical protein
VQQGALAPGAITALDGCQPIDFVCSKASKRLDTSLITKSLTDRLAVLGGGMENAVEEAQSGELPGLTAAAAAASAAAKSAGAAPAAAVAAVVLPAVAVVAMLLQLLL